MFKNISRERAGEGYIFAEMVLWSLFPVITVLSYKGLPSVLSLAWSTFFSIFFFAVLIVYRHKGHELKNRTIWPAIAAIAVFIGLGYYGLYFTGLSMTTPGNASIMALFEVCTSFLFFHIWRKDAISREHIVGALFMLAGAILVLIPKASHVSMGDYLILAATFTAPIGNFFQQKIRKEVSSETIMFLRSLMATPILFVLAYLLGARATMAETFSVIPFLIINGVLLFGLSKIWWLEGIHRISVIKANALASFGPLATLFFAFIFLHHIPTSWQIAAFVPMVFGILLLTDNIRFTVK